MESPLSRRTSAGGSRPTRVSRRRSSSLVGPVSDGSLSRDHQARGGRKQLEAVLDFLYRRKWLILLLWFGVVVVVGGYTFTRVPEYQAHSFIMVDLVGKRPPTSEGPVTEQNMFARNDRFLSDEIFLLQTSHTIAQRVAERLQEIDSTEAGYVAFPPRGYVMFGRAGTDITNSIRVTAVSPIAAEAALLANLYAEEYVRLTREASRSYSTTSRAFLENQEEKRREELRQAGEQLENYLRKGAVGLDQQMRSVVTQIASLEADLDEAQIDLQMRQVSLEARERELGEISPQLVQSVASGAERKIQALQDRIGDLEKKKVEALLRNPNMRESNVVELEPINRQIDQLYEEVQRLSEEYVAEVKATGSLSGGEGGLNYVTELKRQAIQDEISIKELEARIAAMQSHLQAYRNELSRFPEQSMELAQLELAKEQSLEIYQSVVRRLQEARIAEESEPGYAQIIRNADIPLQPVRPDKTRYLFFGAACGLLIGIGLALTRDKLDNRIYKVDQLYERGYDVLGIVPNMRPLIRAEHKRKAFVEYDGRRLSTSLVTLHSPMNSVAEAYRHLRTNIQFSPSNTVMQVLLVTSANMGDGKSITASNLAIVMAQAGRRTLLIDADLRRPQIHELFDLSLAPGLLQFLSGEVEWDLSTLNTGIDNLYAITAGKVVANSSELLGSKQMREMLLALRNQFDIIVVDTPPLRAVTDAAVLSTQCDATIVVARAGKSKEDELDYSMDMLRKVGARFVGALFNGFELSMAFGHSYRYTQYGKYAQYSKNGYYAYKDRD